MVKKVLFFFSKYILNQVSYFIKITNKKIITVYNSIKLYLFIMELNSCCCFSECKEL